MNIRNVIMLSEKDITDNTSQITRCTIKVNYNYTFPRESRKIFSIRAGVPKHTFPSSRKPSNTSFRPRGPVIAMPMQASTIAVSTTELYIGLYILDTVPPIHVVWNHVGTDKLNYHCKWRNVYFELSQSL